MKWPIIAMIVVGMAAFGAIIVYHHHLEALESVIRTHVKSLPEEFASYVDLSDSIRTLHEKKKPVQPGDWLETFPEGGQTFAHYVVARNYKPLKETFTTIYVQPLGDFDATQRMIVAQTTDFLRSYFGMKVELLEELPLGEVPETARRMRNDTEQILTTWILNERLLPERPANAVAVIGLVTCDLWPGDLNWVFGSASLVNRVGVWSNHRYGDPHEGEAAYQLCLKRTIKIAAHETGHMLGIPHCSEYECCMNGSKSRDELDRQSIEFCPECLPKVWWTCGADAAERSQELTDFAIHHGLTEEALLWKQQHERLAR